MLRNLSKPAQAAVILLLAAVAYVLGQPYLFPDAPAKAAKKSTLKPTSKKKEDLYLAEDYKAHFDSVDQPLKDTFNPIIKKVASTKTTSATVNVLPPEFAGGEQAWAYTGTAEIDGVVEALLENRTSGDNVFLKVGDTWKGITVQEITDDSLVLASPDTGMEKTFTLPTDDVTTGAGGPGGFAPAQISNPPLRGGIGPLTAQPDPNTDTTAQQDTGAAAPMDMTQGAAGTTGRGRGRRGRRGGGFGRGGYGG